MKKFYLIIIFVIMMVVTSCGNNDMQNISTTGESQYQTDLNEAEILSDKIYNIYSSNAKVEVAVNIEKLGKLGYEIFNVDNKNSNPEYVAVNGKDLSYTVGYDFDEPKDFYPTYDIVESEWTVDTMNNCIYELAENVSDYEYKIVDLGKFIDDVGREWSVYEHISVPNEGIPYWELDFHYEIYAGVIFSIKINKPITLNLDSYKEFINDNVIEIKINE